MFGKGLMCRKNGGLDIGLETTNRADARSLVHLL